MLKLFLLLSVAVIMGETACVTVPDSDEASTQSTALSTSPRVKGAKGKLVISMSKNKSSLIDLTVKNLRRPERILPKAKTYMVWEVPKGSNMRAQPIGILPLDKKLNGHLVTATPFRQFDIFVTAESRFNPTEPTGERLLWSSVTQ